LLGILSKQLLVVVARQAILVIRWTENGTLEIAAPLAAHHFAGIAKQTALIVLAVIGTLVPDKNS
jgi:hypothetical protein